jgi:protein-disulfide isomerase
VRAYVATGQVLFEYRDYAFLGQESVDAAEAAYCALDQGKFWAYHNTLFANQHGENKGAFTSARLADIAEASGLDLASFNQCVENETHEEEDRAMLREAANVGINSTPSLVVNGKLIQYNGYDGLKATIEAELKK